MKELIIGLLMWLSANSPLPWDGTKPPEVIPLSVYEIAEIYYGSRIPYVEENIKMFNLQAVYNWKTNSIHIRDTIDLTTLSGKTVLAHELVHYLQYRHGLEKNVTCLKELEPLAYEMQLKYHFDQGGEQIIIDPRVLIFATTCGLL